MKRLFVLFFGLLVLGVYSSAFAVETVDLGDLVVTGSYSEMSVKESGASIKTLSGDELSKKGISTVKDALKTVTGLDVSSNGSVGGKTSVFMRGMDNKHTVFMIDGVKLFNPSAANRDYDISALSLDNVEKIEVVRGVQSSVYGADAVGGVINIITKKGTEIPEYDIAVEVGSHDTFRESMGMRGAVDKLKYSLNVSRVDSDGISNAAKRDENSVFENDEYEKTILSGRLDYDLSDDISFGVLGRYNRSRFDLDDGKYNDDINYFKRNATGLVSMFYNQNLTDLWSHDLKFSVMTFDNEYYNDKDDFDTTDSFTNAMYKGRNRTFSWNHQYKLTENDTISAGFQYNKEQYSQRGSWGVFNKKTLSNNGYYIENKISLLDDHLFNTLVFRADDHSKFGTYRTFKADTSYLFDTGTRLKANFATGFKAPSMYQIYGDGGIYTYANKGLQPEKIKGYDFGIEQEFIDSKINTGLTYFHNNIKNRIEYDYAWPGTYNNVTGRTRTKGVEAFVTYTPIEELKVSLDYTYLDARNLTNDMPLRKRARNKYGLAVDYRFLEKANLNLNIARYVARYDTNYVVLKNYTNVDLGLSYDFTDSCNVYARVVNLFDEFYEEVRGYSVEGRSLYAGVKLKF